MMAATVITEAEPSSDASYSNLPVVSSPGTTGLTSTSNSTLNISLRPFPGPASALTPTPTPAAVLAGVPTSAQTPAPIPPTSSAPVPQSPLGEKLPALLTESPNAKPPAEPSSTDSKVSNMSPGIVKPSTSALISSATQPAPIQASAILDTAPAPALAADAAPVTAQSASAPETGFAASSNLGNAQSTSSLTPNPNPLAQSLAGISAMPGDAPANAKTGVFAQSALAANPPTAAGKKSAAAPLNDTQAPSGPSSSSSSTATLSPGMPAGFAAGKDFPVPVVDPGSAPAPPVPQSPAGSDPAPPLLQAHQILDSAPLAPPTPTPAPIVPGSAADVQMNAQVNAHMNVGIRTDAFGSVEIHTVVQQSQIGITVHADRDIARWFNSEVPGLESGLNKSHLNLTAVDFDSGRSGVQTATSFQHGQPRQGFSQTPGPQSEGLPGAATREPDGAAESATVDILPSGRSAGPAGSHFSIHV